MPNRLRLQPFEFSSNNYNVKFDDMYLLDGAGSTNNNFIGECRIQTSSADTVGSVADFVPLTGVDHVAMVSEQTSDDDTTYVTGSLTNQRELFKAAPLSFTGQIFAVVANATHRKNDVGSRTVAPEVRVAGSDYEGDTVPCLANYRMARKIFENNPATSTTWTLSDVNNMEFGLVIKS